MTYCYDLELSDQEYNALAYMAAKGYDCGMLAAIDHEATRTVHVRESGVTYQIPEYVIWPVHEEYNDTIESGNSPWGPFAEHELQGKLDTLLSEVV